MRPVLRTYTEALAPPDSAGRDLAAAVEEADGRPLPEVGELRPDGRLLGEVSLPPNFTVHEIGGDWILGVWRDELDIQSVRVYPLIKPAT